MNFDINRFIAGFVGCLSFQILHPLDVLRTRMQSMDGSKTQNIPYEKNYRSLIINMIKKEGIWSLYRGVLYTLPLNLLIGIFFSVHEKIKKNLNKIKYLNNRIHLNSILSTSGLGFFFSIILNPFYTIKVWLLLDVKKYKKKMNILKAVQKIHKIYGKKGFYRGFVSTYFLTFNKTLGIFFNDIFKFEFNNFYSTNFGNFFLGGLAKLLSSTLTYPISTIRTRVMQNQEFLANENNFKYEKILNCSKFIFRNEGFRGFFNGYCAYAPKTFLGSGILFTVYEKFYKYLDNNK